MIIRTVKIKDLKAAAYNPRKDLQPGDKEYDKLAKSIAEFDYIDPVIWNKRSGNIVGGHQRLKILKELGHTEIDVSVVDLDDVKEKALNLTLNKIGGDWDLPKLSDLLLELDVGDIDIEITGFDAGELEALLVDRGGEIARDSDNKSGASPWDRVGDKNDDVLLTFGELTINIQACIYDDFIGRCNGVDDLQSFIVGILKA